MSTSEILLDTSALIAFLQGRGIGKEAQAVLAERRGVVAMDQKITRRAADLFTTLRGDTGTAAGDSRWNLMSAHGSRQKIAGCVPYQAGRC